VDTAGDRSMLADAIAVLVVDLMSVLSESSSHERLEQLANRLDDRGRTPNGTDAAALLGDVSKSLMRMGL
jgi:formiminotetrahydrofolate cyclodeaminase